ncbi:MAG: protein kinase domain-containing protein [Pirellulales bacterium]
MSEENHCPRCGAALPAQSPQGLCPGCLLKWGLASQTGGEESGSQPAAADGPPPAPEEIAAYFPDLEILELIGRGGMGVVYKARQKRLDRLVALKILAPKVGQDRAFAERFAREARAMAMLSHPHIVAVHDFGQTDGLYYFIMEFVDGVNLRRLLDTGKLAPEEALAIVPQICEALQYAHDHGVVHRDIKPENVLLDKEGRVKIADFGIAKLVGKETKDLTLTGAGQIVGTPQYMAPEQIEHPLQVDHRADIYSLGVVFYQMLTGELPIGRFAPPSKKVQIDVRLDEVVLRALEKEPEQRYQQASEIKTQVESIVTTQPPIATAAGPASAGPSGGSDWRSWVMGVGVRAESKVLNWRGLILQWLLAIGLCCLLIPGRDIELNLWTLAMFALASAFAVAAFAWVQSSRSIEQLPTLDSLRSQQPQAITADTIEQARRQVRGPAIGLLVAGIVGCVVGCLIVAWFANGAAAYFPPGPKSTQLTKELAWYVLQIAPLAVLLLSILIVFAAIKMRRRGVRKAFAENHRIRSRRTPPLASDKEKKVGLAALVLCLSGFPLTLLLAAVAGRNWSVWTFLALILSVVLVALIGGLVGRKSGAGKAAIAISSLGLFAALAFLGIVTYSEVSKTQRDLVGWPSSETIAPRTATTEAGFADVALQPQRPSTGEANSTPRGDATSTAAVKRLHHFQTADRVKAIACSPDGRRIAIAYGNPTFPLRKGWKPTAEVLDAATGKTIVSLKLTTDQEDVVLAATEGVPHWEVESLAFSPDGKVVAVGTGLGQVKLFNAKTGEIAQSLDDEKAKLAEKKTPEKFKSLKRAMGSVASLAFSPDGSLLATCGKSFDDIALNWGGIERLVVLTTGPGRLKVWDVKTGVLQHDLVGYSQANVVAFSPDGRLLAGAGSWLVVSERRADRDGMNLFREHGNGVIIWNPQTGTTIRTIARATNGGTHAVAFSPNSKLLAIGSRTFDKDSDTSTTAISLTHALTGIMDWQHTVPGWAKPLAFLPNGKSIAVLCGGEVIRFLDAESGTVKDDIWSADSFNKWRWNDFAIATEAHLLSIGGSDVGKRGFVEVWKLPATDDNHLPSGQPAPKDDNRADGHSERDDRDGEQIVGTWKVVDSSSWDKMFKSVGVAEDGKTATGVPVTKEEAKAAAQRTPTVITKDTLFGLYQYKLDASKNPKAIDVLLDGKVVMLGIYDLKGDRLQFHFTKTPERPTSFAYQPDSDADDIFLVLQRTTAADGNASGSARSAGAPPGAKLEALQGKWKVVRVEKGKGGDQAWGRVLQWRGWDRGDWHADPSDTYRFEFHKSDAGSLVIHSHLPQTLIVQFRSDPRATPKTIDFYGTGGGVDALLGSGIYEIEPNRLTICLTANEPGLQGRAQRPMGFSVSPDSANILFVLEPYRPPPEERTVAGTWEITTHRRDGEAVSHAGLPIFRRWTFFGDLVTMNDERSGRFALNVTTQPNEITWAGWEGVNEKITEQHFNGIYRLDGDRLTIAYRTIGPRPDKFESTPGSGVTLLVLERARANGKSEPNNSIETP